MTGYDRFVLEADQLTAGISENGARAKMICSRVENHRRTLKFKTITRLADKARRIFYKRIEENKNGTRH